MRMATDLHHTLLETYFFKLIDRGKPPEQTPLLSGRVDGQSLVSRLQERFAITSEQANAAIEAARREVEL